MAVKLDGFAPYVLAFAVGYIAHMIWRQHRRQQVTGYENNVT